MFKPGQKVAGKPPMPQKPPTAKRPPTPELMRAQAAALRKPKGPPMREPDGDEGSGY